MRVTKKERHALRLEGVPLSHSFTLGSNQLHSCISFSCISTNPDPYFVQRVAILALYPSSPLKFPVGRVVAVVLLVYEGFDGHSAETCKIAPSNLSSSWLKDYVPALVESVSDLAFDDLLWMSGNLFRDQINVVKGRFFKPNFIKFRQPPKQHRSTALLEGRIPRSWIPWRTKTRLTM